MPKNINNSSFYSSNKQAEKHPSSKIPIPVKYLGKHTRQHIKSNPIKCQIPDSNPSYEKKLITDRITSVTTSKNEDKGKIAEDNQEFLNIDSRKESIQYREKLKNFDLLLLPENISTILQSSDNRYDKRDSKAPYTYIIFNTPKGHKQSARLLNTVPKKILVHKGLQETYIDQYSQKEKANPLSDNAITANELNTSDFTPNDRKKGFFLGSGAQGTVKFAEIYDKQKREVILVAAKKSLYETQEDLDDFKKEKEIQEQAGNSTLQVYGISDTKNKKGESEIILLTEIAKGISGDKFIDGIDNGSISLQQSEKKKIALNLAQAIKSMHYNGVYHNDLKWDNVYIDPDNDFSVKIIDFGLAKTAEDTMTSYKKTAFYIAPEFTDPNITISNEKADIYSLGIMLIDLYKSCHTQNPFYFSSDQWYSNDSSDYIVDSIKEMLDSLKIPTHKKMIKDMLKFNQADRLSIDEVIDRIKTA